MFNIYDIDASNFPIMRAKFYVIDQKGLPISDFSIDDFILSENGKIRKINQVTCPEVKPALALSSVLVVDASGSMGGLNIHLAKTGASAFISSLRNPRSETAINVFDDRNHLISGFTNDKSLLLNNVEKIFYNKYGFTNYNAGLIEPNAGALHLLKQKGQKKLIIFLTDGKPTTETRIMDIVNEAINQEAKIYSVAIRMSIQPAMLELSKLTGGRWYDNIFTEEQASSIYKEILEIEQGENTPCTIEWISESVCQTELVNVELDYLKDGIIANAKYTTPPAAIAKLEITPFSINYHSQRLNFRKDTTIQVTARNHDFEISNILVSNPNFNINPKSFSLKSGESRLLTVSFTPRDSAYAYCEFRIVSDKCPESVFASGGWPGKVPPKPTLKLIHPNGGEMFVAGVDTLITWEGITPTDTVSIEYSINNGNDWNLIEQYASGLKYNWKNVPKTPSNECLVRLTQISETGFDESAITGGSLSKDNGQRIISDINGNIIMVGNFVGNAVISGRNIVNRGGNDFYILKYNAAGQNLWARAAGSNGNEYVRDVAVDKNGNIYITGEFSNRLFFATNSFVTSKGSTDVFVAKYNPNGNLLWVKSGGGTSADFAGGIAVDLNSNVVISGIFSGNASFMFEDIQSKGGFDTFIVSYAADGSIKWVRTGSGPGNIISKDVAYDNIGNFVITGYYNLNAEFGNQSISSIGNEDIFIVKYDVDGNIQWAKSAGGGGNEYSLSISCDPWGASALAGGFRGIFNFGASNLTSRDFDAFVAKIDQYGNFLWASSGGGVTDDMAFGVSTSSDGSIAMAGYITGNTIFKNRNVISNGGRDAFVARFTGAGKPVWIRSAGGLDDCTAYDLTFDNNGNIVATGAFKGDADFGLRKHTSRGDDDSFLWRINYQPLQTDLSDSVFSIVMPVPVASNIDMRQAMVGSLKDSVVENYIRNNGSYLFRVDSLYFTGADANAFDIVSGNPPYFVQSKSGVMAEFRFRPLRIGAHNAEIVIITQADTLIHTIKGIGVQPQIAVVNPVIDFGIVQVGDSKDTIRVSTVKNIGNATLYITETKHSKPNDVDFTTIAGGVAFQLKQGEEAKMDLRFFATENGFTNGTLEFHYSGVGSPAVIQLYGEGVDLQPRIIADFQMMPDLICSSSSEGLLKLTNVGINPLIISDVSIVGPDATDFNLPFSANISIAKDSVVFLYPEFNPKSEGVKNCEIVIKSNSAINPELRIPITAIKDSVRIIANLKEFNFGAICPNENVDTNIILFNEGTISSSATILYSDNLEVSDNSITIDVNQNLSLNVRFKAQSEENKFEEWITIIDDICNYEYKIDIIADVKTPIISANDIFIQSYVGQSKVEQISIINNGTRDVTIEKAPIISAPFSIDENQFPLTIESGKQELIDITFTPSIIGDDSITVNFSAMPCNIDLSVQIKASAGAAGAILELPNLSAFAGEAIEIPIIIKNAINLSESGILGFDIKLTFNPTVLTPVNGVYKLIDESLAELTLENIKPLNNGNLTTLIFNTGLGNSEYTDLKIIEVITRDADANIETIDGKFTLLGICYEGGARLINPNGKAGIKQISPNPANDNVLKVIIENIEVGRKNLYIYNSIGHKIEEIILEPMIGEFTINIDLNNYPSGVYTIIYNSSTVTDTKKFTITK